MLTSFRVFCAGGDVLYPHEWIKTGACAVRQWTCKSFFSTFWVVLLFSATPGKHDDGGQRIKKWIHVPLARCCVVISISILTSSVALCRAAVTQRARWIQIALAGESPCHVLKSSLNLKNLLNLIWNLLQKWKVTCRNEALPSNEAGWKQSWTEAFKWMCDKWSFIS